MSNSHVHCEELPNGLTILLREARLAPVANLQMWCKVGSADERPGEEGLAHFHEHMLFKGTETRGVGEVAGDIEAAGGNINAYTSFDMTVYYATLPSEALRTGVDVLSDALLHSIFDPDEVKRETEVVLEEIRRSEDAPGHVLGDAVFREAFHVHPYGQPILGPAENVASFDRQRVMDFWNRWYTPENLVVVAAGDFRAPELADWIRAAFEGTQPGSAIRNRPAEPRQTELRTRVLRRPFEGVRLDLTWPSACFHQMDAAYLELLSFLLGECESSRLVRGIKERDGLVHRIDSSTYAPLDRGLFSVNIEADGGHALQAIEAAVAEVERLHHEPVSQEELDRARTNFLASESFERESVSGLAGKLGSFQVMGGDWRSEELYFDTLRGATRDDLLRVAREYLQLDQLTVGALLPESEPLALDHDIIATAVDRGAAHTRNAFAVPRYLERREPRSTSAAEIVSYELMNGASLHVMPRREIPVVATRAAFRGGLLAETPETAGISSFLTNMWLRGTRSHSTGDFARSAEDLAADIDGFSGRNSMGLTLDVLREELEPSLDLWAETLLEPAFDPEELERERRDTLAAIDRREDHLAHQTFKLFGETLYPEHPYRLSMIGTRESVAAFDPASIAAFHERLVHSGNLVIAVAGDVDPDHVAQSISTRLAALPQGPAALDEPAPDAAPSTIRRAEAIKDRAQSHLVLGFPGLTLNDPDRYALEVISQILAGQGGRLFLELRDRRSLAYTVSAANVEGLAPGFFSVYIATAPEKSEEAERGILEELDRLVETAPAAEELQRAIRYLTGTDVISLQRNSSHAAHMALDGLYGLGPDAHQGYGDRVRAVTGEDVLRVARRIIHPAAYTLATIHP